MMMNKKTSAASVALVLGTALTGFSGVASATGSLNITDGVYGCKIGGTYPACTYGVTTVSSGSYFGMDTNTNGAIDPAEQVAIDGTAILDLQDLTVATGSHFGPITGTEGDVFDVWFFNGSTGMDYLSSPMNLTSTGANTFDVDMSGWTVTWNAIPVIPMGGDTANFPSDSGVGSLTCGVNCAAGDTYTLTYAGHVPLGDVSGFGGTLYELNLTGTIATTLTEDAAVVPVPAAVWLFGSGLLGLVGVARRKKQA